MRYMLEPVLERIFDEYLDETNEYADVCGMTFPPSDVLKTDPIAYRDQLLQYQQSENIITDLDAMLPEQAHELVTRQNRINTTAAIRDNGRTYNQNEYLTEWSKRWAAIVNPTDRKQFEIDLDEITQIDNHQYIPPHIMIELYADYIRETNHDI